MCSLLLDDSFQSINNLDQNIVSFGYALNLAVLPLTLSASFPVFLYFICSVASNY